MSTDGRLKMYKKIQHVSIGLLMSFSSTVLFAEGIAEEKVDTGGLTLSPVVSYDLANLRVSSNSSELTTNFKANESIRVDTGSLADGIYYYELLLSTASADRENNPNSSVATQNGGFIIKDGITSKNNDITQASKAQAERIEMLSRQSLVVDSEE